MFREIDDFVIEQLDKAVQFVNDWLFLSQKRIEQGVLLFYVIICLVSVSLLVIAHHSLAFEMFADCFIFLGMWLEYKSPKTERTRRRISDWKSRLLWLSAFIFVVAVTFIPSSHTNKWMEIYYVVGGPIWGWARTAMAYLTVLDVEGERGKAAKLSWSKIKELFGTSWVPKPVGAGA